nr:MAG TPA: Protein of unknown function (DUF1642) [Caudoviricetes sp.]
MNKQELKQLLKDSEIKGLKVFDKDVYGIPSSTVLGLIDQLDEPQAGHAEEAPRYVKNVIARLRELPLHDREVWLKAIMSEFEKDFSRAKWREGYEQGRFENMIERKKVTIPEFVADIIEEYKGKNAPILDIFDEKYLNERYRNWLISSLNAYDRAARAWLDGYEVEKEKRYLVKIVGMNRINGCLSYNKNLDKWFFGAVTDQKPYRTKHTRKQLEESGFGWVFDCPGIEVEEV